MMSAFLGAVGVSPLPTFVNSRGVGVSGMPMSAISRVLLLNYCIEYLFLSNNNPNFCRLINNVLNKKIIFDAE